MPLSRPYKMGLDERLKDIEYAAAYLNAAQKEGVFLLALRDVAEVHKISKVAKAASLNRESLYRALSEHGNPTFETLDSILGVLGLEQRVVAKGIAKESSASGPISGIPRYSFYGTRRRMRKKRVTPAGQLKLVFPEQSTPVPPIGNVLGEMPGVVYIGTGHFGIGVLASASAGLRIHSLFLNQKQQEQTPTVPANLLTTASTGAMSSLPTF